MSDELTREQVERWWLSRGYMQANPCGGFVLYRKYEQLRASREVERERAEKAEKDVRDLRRVR